MSASGRIIEEFQGVRRPIRLLGASGQLGYGIPAAAFKSGIERRPDLIGCDMGSVDISIPPAAGLRLGQFVRVRIVEEERRNCLTVPADSIVKDADGKATISIVDRDWAVPQPVQIGLREGDMVEVQGADLRPGLTIVTTGAYGLSGKTKIHVLDK